VSAYAHLLYAHQLCVGTWSVPPVELRNPPTKAAISSKRARSCISISDAGGEREPPSVEISLRQPNGVKR
jgi:hypothetical protein